MGTRVLWLKIIVGVSRATYELFCIYVCVCVCVRACIGMIISDLTEVGFVNVDSEVDLVEDAFLWHTPVNAAINMVVP
jgi:hypothetical protein